MPIKVLKFNVVSNTSEELQKRSGTVRRQQHCNGRTDRQTDRFAISMSRVSMLTRDKNLTRNNSAYEYRLKGLQVQSARVHQKWFVW